MKDYTPQNTASGLTAKITQLAEALAAETDAARVNETMLNYLACCARFHQYSANNIMLILLQRPDASHVAGYNAWLRFHRYVKKGEKGIAILAPCAYKKNEKDKNGHEVESSHLFFKVTYVFDVSQTEGEPLPPVPAWVSGEQDEELNNRLLSFAASKDITVIRQPIDSGAQGESHGGLIVLAPTAGTKTLIHELAHEILHQGSQRASAPDRETRELEAEATAYVVATAAGMQIETSANYIALWNGDAKAITARLARIQQAADQILKFVFPQAEQPAETIA